jgi:hypothetical protein
VVKALLQRRSSHVENADRPPPNVPAVGTGIRAAGAVPFGGLSAAGLLTGLVVVGVGAAVLWYYLGPDLKRYLKIREM